MDIISIEENFAMWIAYFKEPSQNFSNLTNSIYSMDYFIKLKEDIWDQFKISYQIFNPDFIISLDQLKLVLHHVKSAFSSNTNISKQLGMEFLLYLSHQRQIKRAIEKVGVKFPENKDQEVLIGEILFGELPNLNSAIEYLKEKLPKISHKQFIYSESKNWEQFISKFQISLKHIKKNLKMHNVKVDSSFQKLDDFINKIPQNLVEQAIVDAYNEGMVRLFLKNYKGKIRNANNI